MQKKWVFRTGGLCLVVLLCFLFRFEILNWWQQRTLRAISNNAIVQNNAFAYTDTVHSSHFIYALKGIERIWPHSVNSIKKLRRLSHQFSGFECDIRFNVQSGQLLIGHDATDVGTLSFAEYLAEKGMREKLFWLDVKNLDHNNVAAFGKALLQLDQQFTIKKRIIVESPNTEVLNDIGALGFLTSLYLNADLLHAANEQYIATVKSLLNGNVALISEDIAECNFAPPLFPYKKQLVWDTRFWNSINKDILLKHANDTTILICLINVKSPGDKQSLQQ